MEDVCLDLAKKHGWILLEKQEEIGMISFTRGEVRMNIYLTKMTVATALNHPLKGKTQLFRKNVWDEDLLEKIFEYPRVHTDRGYMRRKNA